MEPKNTIRTVLDDSGLSRRAAAAAIHRSPTFLASYISKNKIPSISLMAEICAATDNELLIRNKTTGRELIIDPPGNDE